MVRHKTSILLAFVTLALVLPLSGVWAEASAESVPVVEGLVDPKPGDVFGGVFWDSVCSRHLDDAIESIGHAKLNNLIPAAECPLVFRDVCTGIHQVVTVNGCSLEECISLVNSLCQQGSDYFKDLERERKASFK